MSEMRPFLLQVAGVGGDGSSYKILCALIVGLVRRLLVGWRGRGWLYVDLGGHRQGWARCGWIDELDNVDADLIVDDDDVTTGNRGAVGQNRHLLLGSPRELDQRAPFQHQELAERQTCAAELDRYLDFDIGEEVEIAHRGGI